MKNFSLVAMLCVSLLFSCTSPIEPIDSNYCVYADAEYCVDAGSQTTCPAGGELSSFCPPFGSIKSSSSRGNSDTYCLDYYDYTCILISELTSSCSEWAVEPATSYFCPSGWTYWNDNLYEYSSSSSSRIVSSSSRASSSSSSAVSSTRCKDAQGRTYFCEWGTGNYYSDNTGCFAIDPKFSESSGTCSSLIEECNRYGYLYVNSTTEGEGFYCNGTRVTNPSGGSYCLDYYDYSCILTSTLAAEGLSCSEWAIDPATSSSCPSGWDYYY